VLFFSGVNPLTAQQKSPFEDNPLEAPYAGRMEWFQKTNLVPNASFEKGQGDAKTFQLTGWQVNGTQVEWVDKTSFQFSANEVYDGTRSIRITRKQAGENDGSDGITSDLIPVIPGNYQFTLYMKLSEISGSHERLGTRLYDAVDLHMEYYDEQKKRINPEAWVAFKNSTIDNSFKGYSFSNFWHIDEFSWGMVIGRSYNYPFSEGDVPAGTRYVRIFLGLKGTGTMWVDKVDLRYSKWNFTPLERIKPFSDKAFTPIEMLVPQPQMISNIKSIQWYDATKPAQVPVILLPSKPEKQTLIAGQLLKGRLEAQLKVALGKEWKRELVVVTSRLTDSLSKSASFIFSLGTNELSMRYADSLPQKVREASVQAYFIKTVAGKIMFLKGNSAVGDYYAVATLVQLLGPNDCFLQSATIIDYPDFDGRSLLLAAWNNGLEAKEDIANLEQMVKWKLNKVYVGYGQPNKNWHIPTDVYKNGVTAAAGFCKKSGLMNLAVMVNPYYHLGYEQHVDSLSDADRHIWTHGDPYSLNVLKNVFKPALDSGASCIMLMADDYVPHIGDSPKNYSLYTKEDKDRFVNLQSAQAYVINDLYKWLESDYPGSRFEFCPPWYLNEFIDKSRGKAEAYLTDLSAMIPEDVAIVWTGNTVRSLSIDQADIYRIRQLIGRNPMLWDNTLYARSMGGNYGGYPSQYPEKIRLCNIFEPLDILVPEQFYQYNDGQHMYVNGDVFTDPYKIKFMTVADFEWNTDAYNADFSVWKALVKTYGKENALKLLQFNDTYFALMQHTAAVTSLFGTEKDNKSKGDALVKDLTGLYNEIAKALELQRKLVAELRLLKDDQTEAFKVAMGLFKQKTKGK